MAQAQNVPVAVNKSFVPRIIPLKKLDSRFKIESLFDYAEISGSD
jgi:hypothetical protein